MNKMPFTTTSASGETVGRNGRSHPQSRLFRLGIAAAWLAIFLLWASWLLAAWVYVRLIATDLEAVYHWDPFIAAGMPAAATGLGVSPALFAWVFFASALVLVATFGTAGVILFRHKQDGFGAFLGVSLVLIGTYIASPVATTLSVQWPVLERPLDFLGGLAFVAFGALLYLFPDGRFIPRWTRWLPPLMFLQMVGSYKAWMPEQLNSVFSLIYLGIGLGAQAYRYRRLSDAMARRHIRWIMMSFAAFMLVVILNNLLAPNLTAKTAPLSPHDLRVTILTLPAVTAVSISFIIALSVAILRDGLYSLDIFINRALVYGGLSLLITVVYILLVGGVGLLAGQGSVMVGLLVATVLVGVGIRPLHTRWQTQIDSWLPPPLPTNHPETQDKVSQPVWLRTVWGIFILLTLVLFAAGLAQQAQNGFWQQPTAEILAVAPLLANPFGTDFFLKNDLYAFVLAGGYLQAAVFVMVGLFLFWRKSGDVMGVLASWMLIAIGLGFTATIVFLPVLQPAWHLPTSLFQAGLFGSVFLFLCLFPNGRFYPHWTRPAAIIWLVYVLLWLPFPQLNLHRAIAIWPAVVFGAVVWLGVVAQLLRYRRISNTDEKQQTKWVIAGFVVANFGLVGIAFLLSLETTYSAALLTGAVLALAILPIFIPLSIGVALLRYRLWQIDIILNRSLVYGGLTAVILAIYILTVGGLSLLFQSQNNLLISLLATGLIAVFFQPVRDRLQRGVNHLLYGDRDEPYKVLSQLGRQLRETAVPGQTLPAITTTICQTLKLPYAAVALHTAEGERRTAATGQPTTVTEEWPLLHQGELVGWLIVAPRTPQERFTERERQLLADIAGQAGAAAYAERLTAALQRSRERLVLAREEERRRIRRDLHDELGPSLASQTFALDTALELLETDPQAAVPLLTSLKSQNQSLIADIRRLVYALRPPSLDELGLLAALKVHISQMAPEGNGLQVKVTAVPDPLPPLPAAVEVAAYRIALEGITNVVRHARARQANIWLAVASASLSLTISDDGVGLPPALRPGVGLASMRERAEELGGTFYVESAPGGGTSITAIVPLMEIKAALPDQLPLVMDILAEAAAWLTAKGINQWPSPPNEHWWRRMERQLANGEVYLAYLNGEAVGTLRLIWSDPYWADDEKAGYVHSLALRNRVHGLKMGAALLHWAMDESRRQGKQVIRLDCGAANREPEAASGRLRRYYEELGFVYFGEVQDHDYTAVLYEKKLSV